MSAFCASIAASQAGDQTIQSNTNELHVHILYYMYTCMHAHMLRIYDTADSVGNTLTVSEKNSQKMSTFVEDKAVPRIKKRTVSFEFHYREDFVQSNHLVTISKQLLYYCIDVVY